MPEIAFAFKVLVLNAYSINTSSATGITLSTILATIPRENLLEVCFYKGDLSDRGIESHVVPHLMNPVRYFLHRRAGGKSITAKLDENMQRDRLEGKEAAITRKKLFINVVRSHLDICPLYVDSETMRIIRRFQPDIVYTLGGNVTILKAALFIAEACDCSVLLHFMDNWRESLYPGWGMTIPRGILNQYISRIEEKSAAGLAISDKMAEEYTRQSGIKYYALMNAIDGKLIRSPRVGADRECKIIYTGGLHLNRHRSLLEVQSCIKRLHENGLFCRLLIYAPAKDRYLDSLFDKDVVTFMDYVPHDKIYEVYDSADILLHIESFNKEQILFTQYSLSTKISEYLSSGKPILCYSPQETAVYQYILENQAGYAASSPAQLDECLGDLVSKPELRWQLGMNGAETARHRHTYEAAREVLCRAISENVANHGIRTKRTG